MTQEYVNCAPVHPFGLPHSLICDKFLHQNILDPNPLTMRVIVRVQNGLRLLNIPPSKNMFYKIRFKPNLK